MLKRLTVGLIIIAACVGLLSECGKSQPPVIEIAAAMPCEIESGGTKSFSVTGSYPADADVHWEASLGSFANPSAIASSYTAPQVTQDTDVTITVNVIDGNEAYPRTLICKIIAPAPTPIPPIPVPTEEPTAEPTIEPTEEPTVEPTIEPTVEPIIEPIIEPTVEPTAANPWVGISFPVNAGTVASPVSVRGSYANLPTGYTIWVAVMPHDSGLYYFQHGPAAASGGTWSNSAYLGSESGVDRGKQFDILVVTANPDAGVYISGLLEQWKQSGNYPGLDSIPAGMTVYHRVTVTLQ